MTCAILARQTVKLAPEVNKQDTKTKEMDMIQNKTIPFNTDQLDPRLGGQTMDSAC